MTVPGQERVGTELRAERERIVRTLLVALAVLGVIAYVPSAWLGIRVGAYGIVAIDTAAYLVVLLTLAFAKGQTTFQSTLLVGLAFGMGLMLSVTLGPTGAGPMWLTVVPAVAAVLLSRRATYLWLGAVFLTGIGIAGAHASGWITWDSPAVGTPLWAVQYGNGLLLGGGVAIAVTALVAGLRSSAERAAQAAHQLDEEHGRLQAAHRRVEEEAAERRQVEAQLRQSEKLTAVGTLATGIAHDFNNLLTPILTAPELLSQGNLPEAEKDRVLGQVEQAALAGRELVRRLLTFSRPSTSDREPVPAGRAVSEAIRLLRSSLPASVRIEVEIAEDVGHILLTPAEVHQVVLNLGSNAHKAMIDGGTLTFHLTEVPGLEVEEWTPLAAPDRAVRLVATDDGMGMDPETADRIFDPFFTTDQERGTGLGLATVQGIIANADGTIRCESEPGQGTTFVIHMPVVEGLDDPSVSGPEPGLGRGDGRHVLLVDDEEPIREVSARALRKHGYQVTPVASGPSALAALETDPEVACLVTDLNMPDFPGTRLAREVRSRYPAIRVVLMTGLMDDDVVREATQIGVDELVAKPFTVDELVAAIEKAISAPA